MRHVGALVAAVGTVLLSLASRALAQPPMGPGMMGGQGGMMGWPMMLGVWLFWILLLILMVLGILVLLKQLRK